MESQQAMGNLKKQMGCQSCFPCLCRPMTRSAYELILRAVAIFVQGNGCHALRPAARGGPTGAPVSGEARGPTLEPVANLWPH